MPQLKDGPVNKHDVEQLPLGEEAMPVAAIVAAATSVELFVVESTTTPVTHSRVSAAASSSRRAFGQGGVRTTQ